MTVAEELIEQGIEKGIEKGIDIGIDIGIEKGIDIGIETAEVKQRHTLLRVLARRFGDLPTDAVAQVEAADLDQLNAWVEGLFTAESLVHLLALTPSAEA